ncbi:MAG: glycosyltransferase [Verrucomicrobiota bacterium]
MLGKWKFGRKLANRIETREVADWNNFNVVCVVHTKAEGRLVEQKGMAREKIHLINAPQHEGVYFPADAKAEREKLGYTASDWVVALHGIIHPSKGYDQVLRWWAEIIKTHPDWKLLIIGGSGEENKCRALIASLRMEKNVLMTGWLSSHAEVNQALNAADCLLVVRRNSPENFGVIPSALFHSLALNKPTVATGLPGLSEIIQDRVNGFLFKPDDYDSFKNTLELVCDNKELAKTAAFNGIQTAKESFDLNTCAQKYFELIKRSVSGQKHGA